MNVTVGASAVFAIAFAIGAITGLRSMTAPAIVSWAARVQWLHLAPTPLAFLGYAATPYILTILAIAELIADLLPKIPSRVTPGPFAVRIIVGGFLGATLCVAARLSPAGGALMGALGAIIGTLGGYESRKWLVHALRVPDFVIALLEDVVAIGGGILIVSRFS